MWLFKSKEDVNKAIDLESGDTKINIDTGEPEYDIVALVIVAILVGMVIVGAMYI